MLKAFDVMEGFGAGLNILGMLQGLQGNNQAASAADDAGKSQQIADNFVAAQLRQNAGQTVAASQREAGNERLKTELMASRAAAVAAAGGGAVTDPTIAKIIGDISGQGVYRQHVALYQGEEKARQMMMMADAKTYEGELAAQGGRQRAEAYRTRGASAFSSGANSLFGKYGMGGWKDKAANASDNGPANQDDWIY